MKTKPDICCAPRAKRGLDDTYASHAQRERGENEKETLMFQFQVVVTPRRSPDPVFFCFTTYIEKKI